jgi:predicted dehydrogenase
MKKDVRTIGLLVGAGSIGKRHAKTLVRRYQQVVVVDPSPAVGKWLRTELREDDLYFTTLGDAFGYIGDRAKSVTAVIANLGPDHFKTFTDLADFGIRRIFCEKPMAHSVRFAKEMVIRASNEGIGLVVGLQRRYEGIAKQVKQNSIEFLGGAPVAIVGHGGAQCLITTGMHWIDFAIEVFEATPISAVAVAHPKKFNPRGPHLDMWGGSASWEFPLDRFLSLTYSNSSSVDGGVHVYCPSGRFDFMPDGATKMFRRNANEILADPRLTRVGEAQIDESFSLLPPVDTPISLALEELDSGSKLTYSSFDAAISLEAAIGALIASENRRTVDFPISPGDRYYAQEWDIS